MSLDMRVLLISLLIIFTNDFAEAKDQRTLKIYLDADWLNSEESTKSIWWGMHVALGEVGYTVNGNHIELIQKNHSGNVTRSLRNLGAFIDDEQAIAVFSGMHSPPILTNRAFINENKIPLLVPWAAAGPITRYPSIDNSIFRLSVDDTKAGEALIDDAVLRYNCTHPYLLLENSPWGDSNAKAIKTALDNRGLSSVGTKRFDWNMRTHVARSIILEVVREEAECIILVSTPVEGAQIALSVSELDKQVRMPIISHWGITGGNFHDIINVQVRNKIDLSFIQTCYSFINHSRTPLQTKVFEDLKELNPDSITVPKDLEAPVGFIHAYDLMKVFIAGLKRVELTNDIKTDRDLLRASLESLDQPIEGLIKTYKIPFTQFTPANPDAHEALGRNEICMASYGPDDEIIVYQNEPK